MPELLIVAWRDRIVHRSRFQHYARAEFARETKCRRELESGSWYHAPEGTVPTCMLCIAEV